MEEWALIVAFLSGSFVSTVISHFLTITIESRHRKRAMRGFLGRWLGRIIHTRDLATAYSDWLEHFWGHYAETYPDVRRKGEFHKRCYSLGAIKPEDIQQDTDGYRAKMSERIQDV